MDTYGELLMMLAFLLAVGMILYRFWTCRGQVTAADRICAVALGCGFLAGGIEKIIHSQVNFLFSLYALGALLSYTAVLCSIPTKEEKDHE